jgi:hypothetical protein
VRLVLEAHQQLPKHRLLHLPAPSVVQSTILLENHIE